MDVGYDVPGQENRPKGVTLVQGQAKGRMDGRDWGMLMDAAEPVNRTGEMSCISELNRSVVVETRTSEGAVVYHWQRGSRPLVVNAQYFPTS